MDCRYLLNEQGITSDDLEKNSVQNLCFGTDRPEHTVQTQIRLLLNEQSDQGLHCLPFYLHLMHTNCKVR